MRAAVPELSGLVKSRTLPGVFWANTVYRNNKPMQTFTSVEGADKPPAVKF